MTSRQRDVARAVAARDRGRSRLRATTAAIGLAGVAVGGVVAARLPGATHPATSTGVRSASKGSSSAAAASGGSAAATGSGSGSSSGSAASAGSATTGSSSATAPTSSSGTSNATSGGS